MALSVQLFVVVCTITYVQCATTTVDTTTETSTTLPTTMKSTTTAAKQSTLISHPVASSSGSGSQISAVTSGGSSPQISAVTSGGSSPQISGVTSGGSSPQITTAPVPKTVNSSNSGLGNGSQQLVTPMVLLMFSVVIVLSFIL